MNKIKLAMVGLLMAGFAQATFAAKAEVVKGRTSFGPATDPALSVVNGEQRELMTWFLEQEYGFAPLGRPDDLVFEKSAIVFGGRLRLPLEVHLPAGASKEKPCPVLVMGDLRLWTEKGPNNAAALRHRAKQEAIDAHVLSRGYAIIHYDLNRVVPDQPRRQEYAKLKKAGKPLPPLAYGVYEIYGGESDRTATSWGTIRTWAWVHSRVLDWMATRPELDAKRVAVLGHSRLGKTALCAGVTDPRFKVTYASGSGCGGAKLNRLEMPKSEHIAQITRNFPYWFCGNFKKWSKRDTKVTHDQDEWAALIAAPGRYLYVSSGSLDPWAGPAGEKAMAESAAKAWEKLNLKGFGGHVGYHCHEGPHNLGVEDVKLFLDFCDTRL